MTLPDYVFCWLASLSLATWPLQIRIGEVRLTNFICLLMLVAGVAHFIFRGRKSIPIGEILLPVLFLVFNFFSFYFLTPASALGLRPTPTHLAIGFLLFLLLIFPQSRGILYNHIFKYSVLLSAVFVVTLVGLHFFSFHAYFLTPYFSWSGFLQGFSQKNQFSFFLALLFPFVFTCPIKRIFRLLLSGLWIFAVGYTFSRMAVLLLLCSLIVLCLFGIKRREYFFQLCILASILFCLAVFFQFTPNSFLELKRLGKESVGDQVNQVQWINPQSSRWVYLEKAWEGLKAKPLFGHGLSSFSKLNPDRCPSHNLECIQRYGENGIIRYPSSHNDYSQIFYELGIIGAALFLGIMGHALLRLLRARQEIDSSSFWRWDAQLTSMSCLAIGLFLINAYETLLFWFLLAGCYGFENRKTVER